MKSIHRFLQEVESSVKIVRGDLNNKEDFKAASQLLLQLWEHHDKITKYKPESSSSLQLAQGTIKDEMKYNPYPLFLKDGDKHVGFILALNWKRDSKMVGNINHLYMRDEYRGKGVGLKLINMSVKHLKSVGCNVMRVGVTAGNEKVIALYKKAGFGVESYSLRQDK